MTDTHVAPRSGADADDGADTALLDPPVPPAVTPPVEDYDDYDLPWRIDVPKLSTLRIVRKELPPRVDAHPLPEDPDGVLTLPGAVAVHRRGRGGRFRLSTMNRLGIVALGSAALGFIGSTASISEIAAAGPAVNPVGNARVIDADLWQAAAPRTKDWTAGPIVFARQDPAASCASAALPADRTASRHSTGSRAVGDQHVTRMATPAAAGRLVERYLDNLRSCQRKVYGGSAQITTLGNYPGVADGLTVVGVFYRLKDNGPLGASTGANLFAVGQDGRFVTALELEVTGARGRIPVEQFAAVAKAALTRLR